LPATFDAAELRGRAGSLLDDLAHHLREAAAPVEAFITWL